MSGTRSTLRVRLLLAQLPEEDGPPIVVAGVDQTIWEHSDETLWDDVKDEWPEGYEWREAWADLPVEPLAGMFAPVTVEGEITA